MSRSRPLRVYLGAADSDHADRLPWRAASHWRQQQPLQSRPPLASFSTPAIAILPSRLFLQPLFRLQSLQRSALLAKVHEAERRPSQRSRLRGPQSTLHSTRAPPTGKPYGLLQSSCCSPSLCGEHGTRKAHDKECRRESRQRSIEKHKAKCARGECNAEQRQGRSDQREHSRADSNP